jgi:dipeptidyl aminopeptidase/acylaminoacyl peptidase
MKRTTFVAFLLCASIALPSSAAKRAFSIEDLYRARSISDLTLSPDGSVLAYGVSTTDLAHGKRTSHIWLQDADGGNAREVTRGDSDASPHFAPDGRSLVFVRSDKDGASNLFVLPLRGGEAKQLTSISTGVSDPVISPDGKWIAFASDVYPECGADDACNKKISERWSGGKLKAHMATTLLYRHWTSWKDGTVTHVLLADAESGSVRDLTPGSFDWPPFSLGGPPSYAFSPDSRELALMSNHDPVPASSTNADIWLLDLTSRDARPRNITESNKAFDGSPKYSPDGRFIAYRRQSVPAFESGLFQLALYDRKNGTSQVISQQFNNWIDDFDWSADSRSLIFSGPLEGRTPLFRVDAGGGAVTTVLDDRSIDAFRMSGDGRTIFYIQRSVGSPSELYRTDAARGAAGRRALSHLNDTLVSEVDIRPAETMWVTGADGARVQVFIVKPHDFDPSKKYPLILNVHGGPQSQWADAFRGDWQVYPGAGYVVAFANPHGSTGFGQEYTTSISGDWGGRPFADLMKVTDALEKLPYVDRDRMGAMGWSYGGYMMNWFEGHTTRFKAIASMMGLYDLRSFYGATEELWFPEYDLKGQPWNSELYETMSPSNSVRNFKTPCMVITGERDYRVPYTQGLQMFTALQKMNVPSRLIVYSNAGHWPSWYEMALYYTAHLEWFHTYLGGAPAPWSSEAFLRNAVFDTTSGKRIDDEAAKKPAQQRNDPDQKAPENPAQGKPDVKPVG